MNPTPVTQILHLKLTAVGSNESQELMGIFIPTADTKLAKKPRKNGPMPGSPKKMFTAVEAAKVKSCSAHTIYSAIRRKVLTATETPAGKGGRKSYLISREALRGWDPK